MNEAILQGAQTPEEYEAAVERAAARVAVEVRNTGGLVSLLEEAADVQVHEVSRQVRSRSWLVRLTNGFEVSITDRTPQAEAIRALRVAAAERAPQPLHPVRSSADLDRLYAAAGACPADKETEIWSAEKDRNFRERGWVLQYVVDVVYLDHPPARIEGDEAVYIPREFVAMAFIPDDATDEQGITAIRSARETLIAKVANPSTPADPTDDPTDDPTGDALYFEAGR
jgi:hypothetical protein